jgi:bacterioferritin-associated ferredoxin
MRNKKKQQIICLCNNISREVIEKAILDGADTMGKIFDCTTAGVGPCGGSCRRKLGPLLDGYLQNGEFPTQIAPDVSDKKRSSY